MTKKELCNDFLQRIVKGDCRGAFSDYVHPEFIHHNAYFKGDVNTLIEAMEDAANESPDKKFVVHRAIEEDGQVVVHSHVVQHKNDPGYAIVHIFRFDEDKIIEMWDVGQPIPKDLPNENGMF